MTEDLAAAIARQQAEHAAREAQPHPYDGVTVAELPGRVRQHAAEVAQDREFRGDPIIADDLEARLRVLAARNERANAAFALRCTLGEAVVPVDTDAHPLEAPTSDLATIIDWWSPGGAHADHWPALPCGPEHDRYALTVWDSGVDWLREAATVRELSRRERMLSWARGERQPDPVDELGVPGPVDDWDEEPAPRAPDVRPLLAARFDLVEEVPPYQPPAAGVRVWRGGVRGAEGRAAMAASRPQRPRWIWGYVWRWPTGARLPMGELRPGVRALEAIPATGAILESAAARFRVNVLAAPTVEPVPDWLVAELGKFKGARS